MHHKLCKISKLIHSFAQNQISYWDYGENIIGKNGNFFYCFNVYICFIDHFQVRNFKIVSIIYTMQCEVKDEFLYNFIQIWHAELKCSMGIRRIEKL